MATDGAAAARRVHGLEELAAYLARELPELAASGENWQLVLHGGRGGDVVAEVTRKRLLVGPRKDAAGAR